MSSAVITIRPPSATCPDSLVQALSQSSISTAFVRGDGHIDWANDAFRSLHASTETTSFRSLIAAMDWPAVQAAFDTADCGAQPQIRVRVCRGDELVWCELRISSDGRGSFMVHTTDITARREEDAARFKDHARLVAVLQNFHAAVLLEDEERKILFTNQTFCDMFGIPAPPEAMIGMDCSNAAEESKEGFNNPEEFVARIETLLAERVIATGDVLELRDGRHLERDYVPVWVEGEYVGHMWSYRDVSESVAARKRIVSANEQLEVLASRDELTGLYNRRAILGHLNAALSGSTPVSVVSVDLDHFKRVNDEHGHPAGDEALAAVAVALRAGRRAGDRVGRVGGEEILLVLPGTGTKGAEIVAESCRRAVADLRLSFGQVTASFGVATTTGDLSQDELLKRADEALYQSKNDGRDRVTVAD